MKTKLLAALITLLLMSSVTSAQSYTIRVTFNTNLRATASLQASIIETAASGTTLNVVSESNRWLRISRNGNEVWMASWVGHSRVESNTQTQTSTQTASNIDNCCFVDRQCSTDQEWTDGYWAFQNKQCTAPAGSQTQTSTQTTSTVSSQIDNCCFVDRQCATDQEWTDGYWAFQNNQCGAPVQTQTSTQPVSVDTGQANNCCDIGWQCNTEDEWVTGFYAFQSNQCKHPGISLEGSPGFVLQMKQALDMLKNRAPHWYNYTIRGLDKIKQVLPPIPCCVGVSLDGRTFSIDYTDDPPAGYSFDSHTTHNAGMLVHEACHVHRYDSGLESGGYPGEKACLEKQLEVTLEINSTSGWIQSYRHTLANIDNPAYQWWRSDHPGKVWVPGG